ncbi:hypothetical protein [Bdellovibrio sp.]|uniref:hypothetical protein n=1 Tax=Bdellovibrio sp. TaxID=28201 RepID=UPI0039E2F63C
MNRRNLVVLLIMGSIAAAVLFSRSGPPVETSASDEIRAEVPQATPEQSAKTSSAQDAQAAESSMTTAKTSLANHLRELGACLSIHNTLRDDKENNFESVVASVRSELGDLEADSLDWKNTHVVLPSGEKRRLRLEIEGTGEQSTIRRLKYYGVDADDLPVPLPLSKEQSINPSDTFLASLEKEGRITLQEEARRGLFAGGAEVYHVERDGVLSEFEISYQGKSFKCSDLESSQGRCQCF